MRAILNDMKRFALAAALAACVPFWAAAQGQAGAQERGRLRLDSLEGLRATAAEHVIVDVDGALIKIASAMLSESDPDEREVKQLVVGLKGVYVRSYEFKAEGQYAEGALAAVRGQLRAPAWSRMVDIKSGEGGSDNVEVYLATEGGRVEGLALVSAAPKKITVVNIVGSVDIEKLRKLEGNLGIPKIHIEKKKP